MNRSSFIRHLSTIDFRKGFDGVPDEFLGKLSVEAIKYLRLTVLRLETTGNGFQLTSVPPTEIL